MGDHAQQAVTAGVGASRLAGGEQAPDSAHEQLLDHVMLRLRLSDGLDLAAVAAQFGPARAAAAAAALAPHVRAGLAEVVGGCASDERAAVCGARGGGASGQAPPQAAGGGAAAQGVAHRQAQACAEHEPELWPGSAAAGPCQVDGHTHDARSLSACVVRLSDPEGFLVSNDIISDVFAALDDEDVDAPLARDGREHVPRLT